jgi:hypothetical protein
MRIYEPLAAVGMVVTPVNIEHATVRHFDARHDLSKLKQESHRLPTLVASRIMRVAYIAGCVTRLVTWTENPGIVRQ